MTILNDHIALMNANAKLNALLRRQIAVVLGYRSLQMGCTAYRFYDIVKFN